MFARTREKCLEIRRRLYPRAERPHIVLEEAVAARGNPEGVFLEIGCGRDAEMLRRVHERFRFVIGVDVDLLGQPSDAPNCRLLHGDANSLPVASQSVDTIAMVHVMEHFTHPQLVLAECARVLRPGGQLFILTVNKWFPPIALARPLPHRLRQAIVHLVTGAKEEDVFPAFYRANTDRELSAIARAAGLKAVDVRHVSHHPYYFEFSLLAYRLAVVIEHQIRTRESARRIRQFVYGIFEKNSSPTC